MAKQIGNSVYDPNRPVHLARSNVFIEKARKQFQECVGKGTQKHCIQMIDSALYYLQSALEHAALAAKSTRTNPMEDSFLAFLRMLVISLYSARLMVENELQLSDHQSPLWQFLHRCGKAREAVKFARNGEQLLEDIAHLFRVLQEPFDDLRKSLMESMSADERERYKLAYDDLHAHLAHRNRHPSRVERFFQIFWPILAGKNR